MKKTAALVFLMLALSVLLCCLVRFPSQPPPTPSLTVMTYNIHIGKGTDSVLSLERIANVINQFQPDLVALQEVDRFTARSGRVDQIARLAQLTHLRPFYAKMLTYQGGEYGIAILSRLPVQREFRHFYAPLPDREQRGLLGVEVKYNAQPLWFFTTHLGTMKSGEEQAQQVTELLEVCSRLRGHSIICGDFNVKPGHEAIEQMRRRFSDCWATCGATHGYTFPSNAPIRRIDYIFYHADAPLTCQKTLVNHSLASDHLAVIATFMVGR